MTKKAAAKNQESMAAARNAKSVMGKMDNTEALRMDRIAKINTTIEMKTDHAGMNGQTMKTDRAGTSARTTRIDQTQRNVINTKIHVFNT
jgi:hypothetical protein